MWLHNPLLDQDSLSIVKWRYDNYSSTHMSNTLNQIPVDKTWSPMDNYNK